MKMVNCTLILNTHQGKVGGLVPRTFSCDIRLANITNDEYRKKTLLEVAHRLCLDVCLGWVRS